MLGSVVQPGKPEGNKKGCASRHLSDRHFMCGGGNSNMFYFHPEIWGRWTHFDEHIFQRGWIHQFLGVWSMIVSIVPLITVGSVIYNHPIGKDYKWYISGIFFLPIRGLYITDPTVIKGTRKLHWCGGDFQHHHLWFGSWGVDGLSLYPPYPPWNFHMHRPSDGWKAEKVLQSGPKVTSHK